MSNTETLGLLRKCIRAANDIKTTLKLPKRFNTLEEYQFYNRRKAREHHHRNKTSKEYVERKRSSFVKAMQKLKNDQSWVQHERVRSREDHKHRHRNDPQFKLRNILRSRLHTALKGNKKVGSAVTDLGCTIEFLKQYLESKFSPGMSWENHGEWHVDHIVPLVAFDLTDRDQLVKACHYTNLQPLWREDNLRKGGRMP